MTVPPVVVGGMSGAAMVRAARFGDGWFLLPVSPTEAAAGMARLAELAVAEGRPTPATTASMTVAIDGDPARPDRDALERILTDPDGMYGMPAGAVDDVLLQGGPAEIAGRIRDFAAIGVERVVATVVAGDWRRQVELLAEAGALAG